MWRRTALAAAALVLGAGACSLIAGLDGLDFDGGAACSDIMPCPNLGPCVQTSCSASGQCVSTPIGETNSPLPTLAQTPGDCLRRVCAQGLETSVVDDTDAPTPPSDCVDAVCSGGLAGSSPRMAGAVCALATGPGVCDGAGTCVDCTKDADCSGPSDECQHPGCQPNHTCAPVLTAKDTPLAAQTTGDCKSATCDGLGGKTTIADDTDLPVDGDACTADLCTLGVASNPILPAGTPCGTAMTCNAASQCASTLPCDDGMVDGTETDVDCGGTCATKCSIGKKCAVGADCGTTFCVDGVCCSNPCTGTCRACSAAKKGSGADGTCGSVAAMTDPDGECAPYTCGSFACVTTCGVSDAACSTADYCDGVAPGTCLPQKASGKACVANHECMSKVCLGGAVCM